MARALLAAYAAVAIYFLGSNRKRPTVAGVIASILWPISLALALTWLAMIDDDWLRG
jgi:hypothetical protein